MRIGHRLCECLLEYANLRKAALQRSGYRYMAGHSNGRPMYADGQVRLRTG